jgi:hypothetical protein
MGIPPTLVLTGPRGAGKTKAFTLLVMRLEYGGHIQEAHCWPATSALGQSELSLSSEVDLIEFYKKYPGAVLVWLETSVDQCARRILGRLEYIGAAQPDSVDRFLGDLIEEREMLTKALAASGEEREVFMRMAAALGADPHAPEAVGHFFANYPSPLPQPELGFSLAHQIVYNNGSVNELAACLAEVGRRAVAGEYTRLALGQQLPPLGDPNAFNDWPRLPGEVS